MINSISDEYSIPYNLVIRVTMSKIQTDNKYWFQTDCDHSVNILFLLQMQSPLIMK